MSRHNSTPDRDRRTDAPGRDAASSPDRSIRHDSDKEPRNGAPRRRTEESRVSGLNRYSLNDLYERSSI